MKKKYDDLIFANAVLHCQDGGTVRQFCEINGYNENSFTKFLNRSGFYKRTDNPPIKPEIVQKLIDWIESGRNLFEFAKTNKIPYGTLTAQLTRGGLSIRNFWSDFQTWEDYLEEWT